MPAPAALPLILLPSVPPTREGDAQQLFGARLLKPLRQAPLFEAVCAALDTPRFSLRW